MIGEAEEAWGLGPGGRVPDGRAAFTPGGDLGTAQTPASFTGAGPILPAQYPVDGLT